MAFGANSKIFAKTTLDMLNNAQAYNLSSDAMKVALFGNTGTPDNTVTTQVLTEYNGASSQWVTGNEVSSSSGWTAGGLALASQTSTQAAAVLTFDAADTANVAACTLANVYGCLVYDTTVSNAGICFNSFGGAQSVTSGTLTVVWNASGIFTLTLT